MMGNGGGTPPPAPLYDLTYISLGGGRQSTCVGICSALGLHNFPKADCAIFADTGDETRATYRHLDLFEKWLEERGIRVYRVNIGTTLAAAAAAVSGLRRLNGNKFFVSVPLFTKNADGSIGVLRRQCTSEFKLAPIRLKVRELLGLEKGAPARGKLARCLMGISLDEVIRMKPAAEAYIENAFPLIDARLAVETCERICKENIGYIPEKSACKFCPYHDDAYWQRMKTGAPEDFEDACQFDDMIRDLKKAAVTQPTYVHRSCVPLREVEFVKEKNQSILAGFGNECEGMCGV
jgi:hypothetical protein